MSRSGDNSFWGIGLPTLFNLLSRQPEARGDKDSLLPGLAWFWHTEADTIDKIDPEILVKDTRIYMATLWRFCTAPVLPFNFVHTAEEIIDLVGNLQKTVGRAFDLNPALTRAESFKKKASALMKDSTCVTEAFEKHLPTDQLSRLNSQAVMLNNCMMRLSRILIPATYSAVDRFDTDLAVPTPPLPRLQPVVELSRMDSQSKAFKFMERKMVRERNRVCHALAQAVELIDSTLDGLCSIQNRGQQNSDSG
jgi:hypothetical protein